MPTVLPFNIIRQGLRHDGHVKIFRHLPGSVLSLRGRPVFRVIRSIVQNATISSANHNGRLQTIYCPTMFLPHTIRTSWFVQKRHRGLLMRKFPRQFTFRHQYCNSNIISSLPGLVFHREGIRLPILRLLRRDDDNI